MLGAVTYARIVLRLSAEELAVVRADDSFDDVVAWLAKWRADASVEAAYKRLIGGKLQ